MEVKVKPLRIIPNLNLHLHLENDFLIENYLQVFESHMFLTTEHFIQSQAFIPPVPFAVGLAENKSFKGVWDSLPERRLALKQFNAGLYSHKGRRPNNGDVGSFLGRFYTDTGDIADSILSVDSCLELFPIFFTDLSRRLSGYIVEFSAQTRRLAAVTPHFYQSNRYPHFHFLYEKQDGTDDENYLQRYLYDKINKVSKFKIR